MIPRQASLPLQIKAKYYPVLAITGPRQAGKSTLVKYLFKDLPYRSLEDLDNREFALQDARGFLAQFPKGAILDEVQHCPNLFSYIQTIVDEKKQPGLFVLTGSQQFGMLAQITQSLAGRVGFIHLLPFSLSELQAVNQVPQTIEALLYKGFYPPIYDRNIPPHSWYNDYILTYIERDIRQIINIQNLHIFQRFLKMCAARVGQLLNLSSLAADCGITHNTARAWISVLEASYIIFLLAPHHRNFNKRLVKSPKLYFYDSGLVCALLAIQNAEEIITHSLRGSLFENWVISEFIKIRFNQGLLSNISFWRDSQGHEIDLIIEEGESLIPLEIKSGQTINKDYFITLNYWKELTKTEQKSFLIYAGEHSQSRNSCNIISWLDLYKNFGPNNNLSNPGMI